MPCWMPRVSSVTNVLFATHVTRPFVLLSILWTISSSIAKLSVVTVPLILNVLPRADTLLAPVLLISRPGLLTSNVFPPPNKPLPRSTVPPVMFTATPSAFAVSVTVLYRSTRLPTLTATVDAPAVLEAETSVASAAERIPPLTLTAGFEPVEVNVPPSSPMVLPVTLSVAPVLDDTLEPVAMITAFIVGSTVCVTNVPLIVSVSPLESTRKP